ncbi:hypothetical protein CEE39_03540, partial [bacterium (candidate division B38) B3_B38]
MRIKLVIIVAFALFCWSTLFYPQQQIPDIRGKIYGKGGVRIKIALPGFHPEESSETTISAAQKVHQVLWDDLQFSGIFQIVKKEYYSLISPLDENRINFEDWASIGAEALLAGNVSCQEDKLIVEGRLFDVKTGQQMIGKRYRSETDQYRPIAHTLAAEVIDAEVIDVGWRVRQHREPTRPKHLRYSPIADRLYEMGRVGQKTSKGWFRYDAGSRTPIPDPEVAELIARTSEELGIERREVSDEEILQRCLYPLINEGAKILEE